MCIIYCPDFSCKPRRVRTRQRPLTQQPLSYITPRGGCHPSKQIHRWSGLTRHQGQQGVRGDIRALKVYNITTGGNMLSIYIIKRELTNGCSSWGGFFTSILLRGHWHFNLWIIAIQARWLFLQYTDIYLPFANSLCGPSVRMRAAHSGKVLSW